jgi:hypothetical protein
MAGGLAGGRARQAQKLCGPTSTTRRRRQEKPKNLKLTHAKPTGSLCCDTAEEARTLIPSLEGKITDEDLQPVLDNIGKLRVFV